MMIQDKRLHFLKESGGIAYYRYDPTFGRWLYKNYDPLRPQRWVRFLLEYSGKNRYRVYYMGRGEQILGYCLVAPGARRLRCSTRQDIVLGPYYVLPEHRGHRYSEQLLHMILWELETSYRYAYDYIHRDNMPSRTVTEACGFQKTGTLHISRLLHRLVPDAAGEYFVYRRDNPQMEKERKQVP